METSKKNLRDAVSAAQFALHECVLFLDTHTDDSAALEKFNMYKKRYNELVKQYESQCGPLTVASDFGNMSFEWINNPWPWEKEAN